MVHWAIFFFVIAVVSAVFAFAGMAAGLVPSIGKVLFVVSLILAGFSLLRGRPSLV
jgi:uncharacterized membrane protein YtjA (UPF0391 family)